MSPTVKALALAGGVIAVGAVVGYGIFGGDSGTDSDRGISSPLDGFTRSHLIPPSSQNPFDPPYDTLLGTNAAFLLYPTDVDPECGPFAGGTPVTISGNFSVITTNLTAAQAAAAYWVYFGGVLGSFDNTFDPDTVTDTEFHVITPVAPANGPADVTIISRTDPAHANMVDAFRYYEPFNLVSVNPIVGPSIGGNAVTITGTDFPIHQPITTAAEAATYYRVLFGANEANFDDTAGDPMTGTEIKVFAPGGPAGTTVDVIVEEIGNPCNVNTLADAYTYETTLLNLMAINPAYGYAKGGLDVDLEGAYDVETPLSATEAAAIFAVYFDGILAQFREVGGVAVNDSVMHVITPERFTAPNSERVDVEIFELDEPTNFATGDFWYVALEIIHLDPGVGPEVGGTPVTIYAYISTDDDILTVAEAESAYSVFFDNDLANFDGAFENNPAVVVAPVNQVPDLSILDSLTQDYLDDVGRFQVLTPPHPQGAVPVRIVDEITTLDTIEDTYNSFVYEAPGLGQWIGVDVLPEVIGALDAGDLLVRIETTSAPDDWNDISVFILPQGGTASETNHRIELTYDTSINLGSSVVSSWRNASRIPRQVWDENNDGEISAGDIFADGHGVIMIEDDTNEIIGDDTGDPSDGGRILATGATTLLDPQVYRHVIIDTIPPVMVPATDPARGSNFVSINSIPAGSLVDLAAPSIDHPADPTGAGTERNSDKLIDSQDEIESGVYFLDDPTSLAQVFVNTGSDDLTNRYDTGDDPLNIDIEITFYDPDLYEYYTTYAPEAERFLNPFTPNPATDGDPWVGGDTTRHPSGFRDAVFADAFYNPREDESVSESLSGGSRSDWVQWRLAPGSDSIPGSLRTNVTFSTDLLEAGNAYVPQYAKELTAVIDFDTTTQPGGIPEPPGSATMHWALYFLAHDTAGWVLGNYFWAGDTPALVVDRLLTPIETTTGPLHIWWMRNTSARIAPNYEGLELYDQTINFELNRGFTIPLDDSNSINDEPLPAFSYRLWRSTVPGRGGYDAEYEPLDGWQTFSDESILEVGPTGVANTIADDYPEALNRWVLIQVLGIDESGNYGQFPYDELDYDYEGPPTNGAGNILGFSTGSGASWMRFFLLEQESSVDTRIRPTIWYDDMDGAIDPGERVILGAPTVLQVPEDIDTEQIRIRFNVEALVRDPADLANTEIEWSVSRRNSLGAGSVPNAGWNSVPMNGDPSITISFTREGNAGAEDIGLDLDDSISGDPAPIVNGGPTTLVFRFRARFDDGSPDGVPDSTPATYSVTIVDDIEEFVENRGSRDNQPIREITR